MLSKFSCLKADVYLEGSDKKEQCLKSGQQKESPLCMCDMYSQPKTGTPDPHMHFLLNHCVLWRFESCSDSAGD